MKDKTIQLSHLQNDEHFQYHDEFGDLVETAGVEKLKVEAWFATWKNALTREDQALKKIAKSARTEEISEVDAKRDALFRGMADTCKTATNHFDEYTKRCAREVQIVFNTYGNLTRKGLTQKTSAIANLLKELRDSHEESIVKIGLDGWATKLSEANDLCAKLQKARWDEAAQRTDIVMKDARAEVDAAYNNIVDRIEARKLLDEGEIFGEFLRRLGVMIDSYNAAIARRRGKVSNEEKVDN
jgi:hypothetical protein